RPRRDRHHLRARSAALHAAAARAARRLRRRDALEPRPRPRAARIRRAARARLHAQRTAARERGDPPAMKPLLRYQQSGPVVTLTMDAPESRNALTGGSAA